MFYPYVKFEASLEEPERIKQGKKLEIIKLPTFL